MNCKQAEQYILLEHSDELSGWRKPGLNRHVAACPACASYRTDVARILQEGRLGEELSGPSARTLEAIRRVSGLQWNYRRRSQLRPGHASSNALFRPAMIYAAVAMLLVFSMVFAMKSVVKSDERAELSPWDQSFEGEFLEVQETLQEAKREVLETVAEGETTEDVNEMASELLVLEVDRS